MRGRGRRVFLLAVWGVLCVVVEADTQRGGLRRWACRGVKRSFPLVAWV